jgi:putative GTP pyrophosphokinase
MASQFAATGMPYWGRDSERSWEPGHHGRKGENVLDSSAGKCDDSDMPWTKPENSRNQINKAGDLISARVALSDMSLDDALDIAGNWRSSHGYPLHVMYQCLQRAAERTDRRALVSKRQKRMPSIVAKLKRQKTMQLSQIQDLGGCRAVVQTIRKTDELVSLFEETEFDAFELDPGKKKDYIANPKDDGYRSVHLIYKYRGESQGGAFKGLRVEVQIRSRLQHAWATALETIDAFKGQGLKSGIGEGPWKRFFVLVSAFMARGEKRPLIPGISTGPGTLTELCDLCDRLNVPDILEGLSVGVAKGASISPSTQACILQLDSKERNTTTWSYPSNKLAEEELLRLEKENADKPHIQTVMASANSVRSLRSAYPSYYADTGHFVAFIHQLKMQRRAVKQ